MTEEDCGGGGKALQKNHQKNKKNFERKEDVMAVRGWRSGTGRIKDACTMNRVPIVEAAPQGGSYAPKGVEEKRELHCSPCIAAPRDTRTDDFASSRK
jgi:hypothetical protein